MKLNLTTIAFIAITSGPAFAAGDANEAPDWDKELGIAVENKFCRMPEEFHQKIWNCGSDTRPEGEPRPKPEPKPEECETDCSSKPPVTHPPSPETPVQPTPEPEDEEWDKVVDGKFPEQRFTPEEISGFQEQERAEREANSTMMSGD